jgi:hypothetical protein
MYILLLCAPLLIPRLQSPQGPPSDGPLQISNQRLGHTLVLTWQAQSPAVLPLGKTSLRAQLDVANNMLHPASAGQSAVLEDFETQRLTLHWRRGLGHSTEFAIAMPITWRNGGGMDPILRAWHRFWGIPSNYADNPSGRESRNDFGAAAQWTNGYGANLLRTGAAFGWGDAVVGFKRGLASSGSTALSARIGMKLPTGNPGLYLGSGNVDVGGYLDAWIRIGREFDLFLGGGGSVLGHPSRMPGAAGSQWQYHLAVQWRSTSRDCWIWQIDGGTVPFRSGHPFADRAPITGSFGYRRRLSRETSFTAYFSENGDVWSYRTPMLGNIAPDFTAGVGLEWRF